MIDQNTLVALFNLTSSIHDYEYECFRINHKIELNNNNVAQLSLCITDKYQNQELGSYLLRKTINIAR